MDQERLGETLRTLAPGVATYQDFRHLLDSREIDAVIVATPDHWHAIPALQAIRSGKDVYLEKPVGHTVEEGAQLVAEAERSDRIVEVGLQQRSGTLFAEAARAIRQGELGKISLVHCLNTWNQSDSGIPDYTIRKPSNSRISGSDALLTVILQPESITTSGSVRRRSAASIPIVFIGTISISGTTRVGW